MRLSARFFLPPLILLVATGPALAAPAWKALGPFGGTIQTITVAPSDPRVVYVTTQYEGAFRSTDGGASWVPIHGAFLDSNIAADPARPGTIYLSTPSDNLVKSTDFGSHWTLANRGLEGRFGVTAVAVDPARPSRLYAALGAQIFRSVDGGASWKPSSQELPFGPGSRTAALLAVSRPRGTVFALADGLLFRSTDAGMTWTLLAGGLPNGVLAVATSPAEPWVLYASASREVGSSLFRSRDSGTTWEEVHPVASPVVSLAVSSRSSRTVWAGTDGRGLLVSHDGGAHWKSAGLQGIPKITAVTVPATSPNTVFAGTVPQERDPGGVFASTDGGATWARRSRGIAGVAAETVAVDPATQGVLWTGLGSLGLFRSANGGRDWTPAPIPAARVALAPSAPSILYAVGSTRMWRSEDGGATWTTLAGPGGPVQPVGDLQVDPLNPNTLWSSSHEILRSVDGGVTWVRQSLPGPGSVKYLAFAPSRPSTMYAVGFKAASGRFTLVTAWRSTDGGATWTLIDKGLGGGEPTALAVDPVDPRLVYMTACGYYGSPIGGIWKSADGGATWQLTGTDLGSYTPTALATSPLAGVVWTAVEDGRIFRSTDSGETWQERPGPQAHVVYQLTIDPQDPRRVYAATSSGVWVLEDEP